MSTNKGKKSAKPETTEELAVEIPVTATDEPADGGNVIEEHTVVLDKDQPVGNPDEVVKVEGQTAGKKNKKAAAPKTDKPAKPTKREDLVKGNRICAACGATEASFIEKNPRYSLCKGVDVDCYRLGHRVFPDDKNGQPAKTAEQAMTEFPHVKVDDIKRVGGKGIEDGLLVLHATRPPRPPKPPKPPKPEKVKESKSADTAATSAGATGAAPVEATASETVSSTTTEPAS